MCRLYCVFFTLFVLIWCWYPLSGQTLFDEESPLILTLETDIEALQADRLGSPKYHSATLRYMHGEHKVIQEINIRARGRFRRDPYVCEFPPLHYKFPKDEALPAPFQKQKKLKVVTHCREDEFIYREYYLYKIYNLLTEKSFRVRLAEITYVDSKGKVPNETHPGFFIESEKAMAKRNKAKPVDEDIQLKSEEVDREMLTLMHIFNYMIANRDFGVEVRQNLKIITNGDGRPVTVPYDFDWAGIVDASYTQTPGTKKSMYYERRRFKPLCRTREEFDSSFDKFRATKSEVINMYKQSPYLSKEKIKETLKYLKNFYKNIEKEKVIQKVFVDSCNS
ncbi:MAG: hypothetical protein AAF587_09720 [Bacteroidota bacterium]